MLVNFLKYYGLVTIILISLISPTASSEPEPLSQKDQKQAPRGEEVSCPEDAPIPAVLSRSQTYAGVPYQAGEEARYELQYGSLAVHVGYGYMRVNKPLKYKTPVGKDGGEVKIDSRWHRVFSVEAFTGDWYKAIFRGNDKLQAFSRPWDGGVSKFYISEDHEKPFGSRSRREKWLEFDHVNCRVDSVEDIIHKNQHQEESYALFPGAIDAVGAVYRLREFDFKVGEPQKIMVYTSKKNWWLEAEPLAIEEVVVKAGTFKAVKLNIKSSVGEDLQQKGKMVMWIDTKLPHRPLIKVEGDVKFGSFILELDQFKPGKT